MIDPGGSSLLFVYGTLLSGEPNHGLLVQARAMGEAQTEPAFDLMDMGDHPALVAGGSTSVVGELYEVDALTMRSLDLLEGHPDYQKRSTIRLADGTGVQAYLMQSSDVEGARAIPSGDWRERFQ